MPHLLYIIWMLSNANALLSHSNAWPGTASTNNKISRSCDEGSNLSGGCSHAHAIFWRVHRRAHAYEKTREKPASCWKDALLLPASTLVWCLLCSFGWVKSIVAVGYYTSPILHSSTSCIREKSRIRKLVVGLRGRETGSLLEGIVGSG